MSAHTESPLRRTRWLRRGALALAPALLLATAGTTVVSAGGARATDEVIATLDFKRVEGGARFCEGHDGTYDQERGAAHGTSSGDPRLSGRMVLDFVSLDRLTDAGHLGTLTGRLRVFDPGTGRKKVDARVDVVQHYGEQVGILVGEVDGGSVIVGNVRIGFVEQDGQFDIVGQIGGETDRPNMPAVIQSGRCSGPFEPYEFDLP